MRQSDAIKCTVETVPAPTTTLAPRSAAGASAATTAIVTAVAVSLALATAVAVILAYHRRKAHTQRLLAAVLEIAPALPAHCRSQADEEFDLRYAELLGSRSACRDLYEARRVGPAALTPTGQVLGSGMFGHVLLARFSAPAAHAGWRLLGPQPAGEHALVAVKEMRMEQGTEAAILTQALLEARLLAVMQHPHIVRLVAVSDRHLPLRLALEFCAEGDLRRFLRQGGYERFAGGVGAHSGCLAVACQVAAAVQYLHSKLCIHRDLAARNVLLQAVVASSEAGAGPRESGTGPLDLGCGYVAKLADLGLARGLRTEEDYYRVGFVVSRGRVGGD